MLKMGSDVGGQFRNNFFVLLLTHTRRLAKTEKISPVPDPLMIDYDKSVALLLLLLLLLLNFHGHVMVKETIKLQPVRGIPN